MIRSNLLFTAITIASLAFTSCNSDNDDSISFTVPTDYTFERNGATAVDFSGQSARITMLGEMGTYISNAAKNATNADISVLMNMYANTNNEFSTT